MGVRYWYADSWGVNHGILVEDDEDCSLYWAHNKTGEYLSDAYHKLLSSYKKVNPDMREVFPAWASDAPSQPSEEKDLSDVNIIREALDGQRGEHQQLIAEYGVGVVATLIRKNSDYKGSAWQRPCLLPSLSAKQALFVRMSDKVARLQNLSGGKKAEVAESVADTVKDLAGYCILWLSIPEEVENDNAEAVESGT